MLIKNKSIGCVMLMMCIFNACSLMNENFIFVITMWALTLIAFSNCYRYINIDLALLFLWGLSYIVILSYCETDGILKECVYYLIGPISFFVAGKFYIESHKNNKEYAFSRAIKIIVIAWLAYSFLSYCYSIKTGAFHENTEVVLDLWGERPVSRTIMGLYTSPSILFIFFVSGIFLKKNILKNAMQSVVMITLFVAGMVVSIGLGNRTFFAILIIVMICFLAFCFLNGVIRLRTAIASIVVVLCIILGYFINVFGIRSKFETSVVFSRIASEGFNTPRFIMWKEVFSNIFFIPFGSTNSDITFPLKYAHNLWVDTLLSCGWIPFVLLVMFSFLVLRKVTFLLRCRELSFETRLLVMVLSVIIFCAVFVEPVLLAAPYYLIDITFIIGMLEAIYYSKRKRGA